MTLFRPEASVLPTPFAWEVGEMLTLELSKEVDFCKSPAVSLVVIFP